MDGTRARALLGLRPDANRHDIKRHYRRLAKQSHPDSGGPPDRFCRLTEAYRVALVTAPAHAAARFFDASAIAPLEPVRVPSQPRTRPRRRPRTFAEELQVAMLA